MKRIEIGDIVSFKTELVKTYRDWKTLHIKRERCGVGLYLGWVMLTDGEIINPLAGGYFEASGAIKAYAVIEMPFRRNGQYITPIYVTDVELVINDESSETSPDIVLKDNE